MEQDVDNNLYQEFVSLLELIAKFFQRKKASETFNNAGEKANKIANETKLKFKINDNKSKIKDIYQEIGKIVYQKFVLDGNLEIKDDIAEQLTKITELTDEIEKYEKQILELGNMKQCVNCKNKIDKNAKFCPSCGSEQPEEVVHEAEIVESEEEKSEQIFEEVNEEDKNSKSTDEENKE